MTIYEEICISRDSQGQECVTMAIGFAITNKSEIEELLRIGLCYDGPWLIATTITTAYYRLLNKLQVILGCTLIVIGDWNSDYVYDR